jgi:hypothetical protein
MTGFIKEFYRNSSGETKKKILGCIFSEKLVIENGRVATTPFTTEIRVLINASKVLEGGKNKKEVENDLFSCFAPLTTEGCNRITSFLISKILKYNC